MIPRPFATAFVLALAFPLPVLADTRADADTLFTAAKMLRDGGLYADACGKFAQSKQLAVGVGVSLYLADCYEHVGRTASAWREFLSAAKLAADKGDKRASVAKARAAALEPSLLRVKIAAAPGSGDAQIDGTPVPPASWATGFPVDPGDRRVAFSSPGVARRSVVAHVDAAMPSVVIRIDPPARASMPVTLPVGTTKVTSASPETAATPAESRRWAEIGLLGVSAVSAGIGGALLVSRNASMTNGPDGPQANQAATVGSAVAFTLGGAAAISAIVLYLTASGEESALRVSPAAIASGGGALVEGRF